MKNYKFLAISLLALGIVSCEPDLDNPIDEVGSAYTNGEADFTHYVALGNSLTAGYADNALYMEGQKKSYPNILAGQLALTQKTDEFTIPYMNDNSGGLLLNGTQIQQNRLVLTNENGSPSPKVYTGKAPTTDITNVLEGPFSNMGVPGAKSYHLGLPGYGNIARVTTGMANPYFVRFASSSETNVMADAMAQNPTFFSLWIGNNDVLGYATSGGVGVNQTGNLDPNTYGSNDITDPDVFANVYSDMVQTLVSNGAKGVLLNIPDVTSIAFFNTVPNNALQLDAQTAASLTSYFGAVSQVFAGGLMAQGVSQEQAMALAAQYAITFNEGPNRFIIDVPVTQDNPLGFRQMTADELIQLQVDQSALAGGYGSVNLTTEVQQVLGLLMSGGTPTPEQANILFGGVNGLDDADVLDSTEISEVRTATDAYNETISAVANANGLAMVDTDTMLKQLANGGISFDGGSVNAAYVTGGAFSLDGVHLTPRGYAIVANKIIDAINAEYNSTVPKVNVGQYGTTTSSALSDEVK
ncbi:G-D-S-L family lipolytic protein [Zunongwangia sp.]|uniref:G-D-S-L family lipolytic protein n=1 Tax=Zunongwangia sp. TaxID=1965325 RepID=UPI003AA98F1C